MTVWIKRLVFVVALAVVIFLFWPLLRELRGAAHLFTRAHWKWLPLVLGIELISYVFLTWLNDLFLRPFPGRIGFFKLMALLTSMAFIETAIPSAGGSGVVLRVRLLQKVGGYSAEVSTFTLALETIFILLAVVSFSLFGFVYLIRSGDLSPLQIALMATAGILMLLLIAGAWRLLQDRPRTHRLAASIANAWNRRFGKFRQIDQARLDERFSSFQSGLEQLKKVPRGWFFLAAYLRVGLDITTLGACFFMFGFPISVGQLLTGYGLILTTSMFASLPGGLGMAELTIPAIFLRLGVNGATALAAGLTYRLIAFWLVRLIGFASWQYFEFHHEDLKGVDE